MKRCCGCAAMLVTMLFASACDAGGSPADATQVEVRDSLGIELVKNASPDQMLELDRILNVGVIEGPEELQFDGIAALAVDSIGGFWVVDRHASVRHYDSSGQYRGEVGGRGEGPGEAARYMGVWAGDGTVLLLGSPRRFQLFSPEGDLVDEEVPAGGDGILMRVLGRGEGRWIVTFERFLPAGADSFRQPVDITVSPAISGPFVEIASFPGELSVSTGGAGTARGSYFHGTPDFAVDPRGALLVSDTLRYRVEVYDLDGALTRVVERAVPGRPYDPGWESAMEEALVAAFEAGPPGANLPPRTVNPAEVEPLMQRLVPSPPPEYLPVIDRLLVAADGSMWVERMDRHPEPAVRAVAHLVGGVRSGWRPEWFAPQTFDVFWPDGAYRGTVELPAEVWPLAVTGDGMYGVFYDELGVESVVAFQIRAEN